MPKTQKDDSIRLEKVTYANAWDIMKLRVDKEQKGFVASNSSSLVEAYLTLDAGRKVLPFGIYCGKKPVGFVMIGYDWQIDEAEGDECETPSVAAGNYMIWRLMIDKRYRTGATARQPCSSRWTISARFPAERRSTAGSPMSRKTRKRKNCTRLSVLRKPKRFREAGMRSRRY